MNVEDQPTVVDVVNIKCQCCGKMIPRKPFVADVQDKRMLFCMEDCHAFYLEYFLGS